MNALYTKLPSSFCSMHSKAPLLARHAAGEELFACLCFTCPPIEIAGGTSLPGYSHPQYKLVITLLSYSAFGVFNMAFYPGNNIIIIPARHTLMLKAQFLNINITAADSDLGRSGIGQCQDIVLYGLFLFVGHLYGVWLLTGILNMFQSLQKQADSAKGKIRGCKGVFLRVRSCIDYFITRAIAASSISLRQYTGSPLLLMIKCCAKRYSTPSLSARSFWNSVGRSRTLSAA